jgi:hypothetical protein
MFMMAESTAMIVSEAADEGYQPVLPGFYGLMYETNEIDDLNSNLFGDLIAEICLLRVVMRRALDKAKGIEDLDECLRVLNALGLASMRLARLLEVQIKLNERSPRAMDAFIKALLEFSERMEAE